MDGKLTVKKRGGKKTKKRRREEESESEAGEDYRSAMKSVSEKLRAYLDDEMSEVDFATGEKILGVTSEYEKIIEMLVRENETLRKKKSECVSMSEIREAVRADLDELGGKMCKVVTGKVEKCVSEQMSKFCGSERMQVDDTMNVSEKRSYAVVVKSSENESADVMREKVRVAVQNDLNVRVKAVRKTRDGRLAIETASENERKQLIDCERLRVGGMIVENAKAVYPRMIVYDVPNECDDDMIVREMYMRNVGNVIGNESEFRQKVRVVMRSGKKDTNVSNVVIECPLVVRD